MRAIHSSLLEVNPFSRTAKPLKKVKGIVLHYTASPGAPAINIRHYFHNLRMQNPADDQEDRYAGAHYAVDRTRIVQAIPDLEMAYHVGSKTYTQNALDRLSKYPNDCTIGIEMCIEKDGSIHPETFQNTVDLTAYLLLSHKLGVDAMWTHKEVVGWKDCPLPWVKNPTEWERFKQSVRRKAFVQAPKTTCEVWVNGKSTSVPGMAINREAYVGIRALAELQGISFQYITETKKMMVNGAEAKTFVTENGTGIMKAREWGHLTGMKLSWMGQAMDIELSQ